MKSLFAILLLAHFVHAKPTPNEKDADLSSALKALGEVSYLQALPGLRLLADGQQQVIADLNSAYDEVKHSGHSTPLVREVVARYNQTHDRSKTALLGTACVLAIVGAGYFIGKRVIDSNPKLRAVVDNPTGCSDRVSHVLESIRSKNAAMPAGDSAT